MAAPKKENPRRAVTYKLPPALLDRVAKAAARDGCTRTDVVERALEVELRGRATAALDIDPVRPPVKPPKDLGVDPSTHAASCTCKVCAPVRTPPPTDPAEARAAAFRAVTRR